MKRTVFLLNFASTFLPSYREKLRPLILPNNDTIQMTIMRKTIIPTLLLTAIAVIVMLPGCRSGNETMQRQFAFLDSLGVTLTEDLLLSDSLTLPDIYCGDGKQKNKIPGTGLNRKQYEALLKPAGDRFANEMGLWQLLGVRDAGGGNTLAVYYTCDNVGYCVNLITYDAHGRVLDAINARELHMVWRVNLGDPDDNSAFTLDSYLAFDGNRVTLHRTMGRCLMDFDKDLKGNEQWQQEWEQDYIINNKGYFMLQQQNLTGQKGDVDYYSAMDIKSWDMLVCSMHDPGIMDTWNEFASQVDETYDPDYQYNPFPWDVAQLYQMNPQRFLRWISAPTNRGSRLLRYFKLPTEDRPALKQEIDRIEDAEARQWLNAIVNSWDSQPLTKHL